MEAELETIWIVYVGTQRVGTLVGKDYQTAFQQAVVLTGTKAENVTLEDSGRKKPKCTTCPGAK